MDKINPLGMLLAAALLNSVRAREEMEDAEADAIIREDTALLAGTVFEKMTPEGIEALRRAIETLGNLDLNNVHAAFFTVLVRKPAGWCHTCQTNHGVDGVSQMVMGVGDIHELGAAVSVGLDGMIKEFNNGLDRAEGVIRA